MSPQFEIKAVGATDDQVREEIISYLMPREKHCLFLFGNLTAGLNAILYTARQEGKLVGVAAFYPLYRSCSFFTEDDEVSLSFGRLMLKNHDVLTLLAMASMAKPAFDEWVSSGLVVDGVPETLFFELNKEDFRPFEPKEGICRPIEERDMDQVCRQLRHLGTKAEDAPVIDVEREKVHASAHTFVCELDGKILSVAMSNGPGIKVFQVLGVATDAYFRNKGYARSVCSALIQHLFDKGSETAIIFTHETNEAARKCYEALGFQVTDRYYVATFKDYD